MQTRPRISPVAAAHIRELRERHQVEPTIEEILWLQELGLDVESPCRGERFDLIGTPIRAGNAWLWPMTVMAAVWWDTYGRAWYANSGIMYLHALAFALAHGRGREVEVPDSLWPLFRRIEMLPSLAMLTDRDTTTRAISWWALHCGATRSEVEAAVDACIPAPAMPSSRRKPSPPMDWQSVIHDLCVLSGESADYWTRGTSMLSTARAYARAFSIHCALSGGGKSDGGGAAADALRAIRAAMAEIIEAHRPQQAEPK